MNKFFSPFLALRYLKPKRSYVSIITLISVIGVALGVIVLVVVMAVFTGFGVRLKESILASQPHLMVDLQNPRQTFGADGERLESPFDEWPNAVDIIKDIDGITSVTPLVNGPVLLRHNGFQRAPFIQAIEPHEGPSLERYRDQTTEGEFELTGQNAVLGDDLAYLFDINIGDTITLTSPNLQAISDAVERLNAAETTEEKEAAIDTLTDLTLPTDLEVVGLFNSGNYQFDLNTIFVPLEIGQEMFDLGPYAHSLAIDTENPIEIPEVEALQKEIGQKIDQHYPVTTWMETNSALLSAVATERNMMFFLLFIIMVVAGFCIMNTMITVVYQKRAEIGLLKALGASESHIIKLFLLQGVIVGILGVALGQICAHLLIFYRNDILDFARERLNVNVFDPHVYGLEGGLPATPTLYAGVLISVCAFVASAVASLIPAWIAARLQPAEALRSE